MVGCASYAQFRCGSANACSKGPTEGLQTLVDLIVKKNFPEESGEYEAVVWMDSSIMNAWVDNDKKINYSTQLIDNLTAEQLLAVTAHEMAHLKLGHYYQTMGVNILSLAREIALGMLNPLAGYLPVDSLIESAFSRSKETEADLEAVKYLAKAGYSKKHFISLLQWIKRNESRSDTIFATHPYASERIQSILKFKLPASKNI
jgi:Zn-dependent protease with chaperone function